MERGIVALDLLFGELRASLAALDRVGQVVTEEQEKVKQRPEYRDAITPRRRAQKRECSQPDRQPCQPLHLHGQKKHDQKFNIRVIHCESEEDTQIEKIRKDNDRRRR